MKHTSFFLAIFLCSILSFFASVFISCRQRPPESDAIFKEYQAQINELHQKEVKRAEAQKRIHEQEIETLTILTDKLKKDCQILRDIKAQLNENESVLKTQEIQFLSTLTEKQLQLYSDWFNSLQGDNLAQFSLTSKHLSESFNAPQKQKFEIILSSMLSNHNLKKTFNENSRQFENDKNTLFFLFDVTFKDEAYIYQQLINESLRY